MFKVLFYQCLKDSGPLGRATAFEHSRWLMINHTAKSVFLFLLLWIWIGIDACLDQSLFPFFEPVGVGSLKWWVVFLLAGLVAVRLEHTGVKMQKRNSHMYLLYAKINKETLQKEVCGFTTTK
ncbi:MAG: hypothetical protein MPJ50_19140 [Pirellulales bacterium]|nr:hypothetical protein [Pirellulales bacterium]